MIIDGVIIVTMTKVLLIQAKAQRGEWGGVEGQSARFSKKAFFSHQRCSDEHKWVLIRSAIEGCSRPAGQGRIAAQVADVPRERGFHNNQVSLACDFDANTTANLSAGVG
eukprot:GILJ01024511.1.p1 GENE.GILJ01024511.1~~GILJ01024511.1.p1  ORF type:complete len:110 (-),score=8.86 GILJ01024511.1:52-381(-)